jgi:peroxiredoxin
MRNRERGLADYRGRKILLVFFSLECEHSRALAPELGLLPKGAPQLVVLSRGDPAEHRKLARENEWTADVLLEEGLEISVRYQSIGTPGAYVIAEDGRIASVLALGGEAVLGIALEATPAA